MLLDGSRFRQMTSGVVPTTAVLVCALWMQMPTTLQAQTPAKPTATTATVNRTATETTVTESKTPVPTPTPKVGLTPAEWLKKAPELAKIFAAARGRSEDISVDQAIAELQALAGDDGLKDPIAAVAAALLDLYPTVDQPPSNPLSRLTKHLQASHRVTKAMEAARTIAQETKDPLAMAIYGHGLAIGLGTTEDRVAGTDLLRQADKAAEPYAAQALYMVEADGVPDAMERAAASGDLRARYDLINRQLANPATREKAVADAVALASSIPSAQTQGLASRLRFELQDRDGAVALYSVLHKRDGGFNSVLMELGADDVQTSSIGDLAPEFPPMDWIQGKQFTLESVRDQKVVVLEFWATWCGPCVASIPKVDAIHRKYGDKVAVVAISDEDPSIVTEFVNGRKDTMTYAVASDTDGRLKKQLFAGFGQTGIPSAFVIGKDGKIAWVGHPQAGLEAQIDQALAATETPSSQEMALNYATNRHLRLISKPGRGEAARTALEPLRGAAEPVAASLLLTVIQAHLDKQAAEPDLPFVLEIVDSVLAKSPEKHYALRLRRGDLLKELGRNREAIEAYTDGLRVLAKEHPEIEAVRDNIEAAEKAEQAAALKTPVPSASPAAGVRPDGTVARPRRGLPRATPLVVAPRGTPLQVAPRGTPLAIAPRGTPLQVAPRGTPLTTNRKASDSATTISIENLN